MFSLFGKKDKTEKAEPSLLERLKASVTKTKAALAETVDAIFLGERAIDPSILKDLERALISADIGVKTTREVLDAVKKNSTAMRCLMRRSSNKRSNRISRGLFGPRRK